MQEREAKFLFCNRSGIGPHTSGYPGQSGQRRLCPCKNRETLLDDGVLDQALRGSLQISWTIRAAQAGPVNVMLGRKRFWDS